MSINIETTARKEAINSLQRYFRENMDEPISGLQAELLFGFFIEEVGPLIYNQAVADAQKAMLMRVNEIDIDVHEQEFPFWRKKRS